MSKRGKTKPKRKQAQIEATDDPLDDVVILIVNFQTERLIRRAVASVRRYYSQVSILLYDNGSHDQSTRAIKEMQKGDPRVSHLIGGQNIGHGPAMHMAMSIMVPPLVFTMDSDAEIVRPYVIEAMRDQLRKKPAALGVGYVTMCDSEGRNAHRAKGARVIRYLHPFASLWNRSVYTDLHEPFIHHGAPCIRTCWKAQTDGVEVLSFPVRDYVRHKGKGTRSHMGGVGPYDVRPFAREEIARAVAMHSSAIQREQGGNDDE